MKVAHLGVSSALGALVVASSVTARAQSGVCDIDAAHEQACIDAIANDGGVVNDIFHDAGGLSGPELPVFARLYDNYPGCPTSFAGCAGSDTSPYDCPGQYVCATPSNDFATAGPYLNTLDHSWWSACRTPNHTLDGNGCPDRTCTADGVGGDYYPWEGLVFDLGGPSNQVALFATNLSGPQPCESIKYSVFLSDSPLSQDIVLHPTATGADPNKWNRAVLKEVFTGGWYQTRQPDPAGHGSGCGDTATYAVELDSFVTVYRLPCSVTFRYAAIVAGNDGLDFPECAYDSNTADLNAVAGLTEEGRGVCPDADKDGFVDCKCAGAPAVCDCNDSNPAVHPGAMELCDSPDLDCDGKAGTCNAGLFCLNNMCVPACAGGADCPKGATCQATDVGSLCMPNDCKASSCPPGSACDPSSKACRPTCTGVTCPHGQKCQDGRCKDSCAGVVCPNQEQCFLGTCGPRCDCFNGDVGCADTPGLSCDHGGTDLCVPTSCLGVSCTPGQHCNDAGVCVGLCDGVTCPDGQKCVEALGGCVSNCDGLDCDGGTCNPSTGTCNDTSCDSLACVPPDVCVNGKCTLPDGGGADSAHDGASGGTDGNAGTDASAGAGGNNGLDGSSADSGRVRTRSPGGCACRAAPTRTEETGSLVALALATLLGAWRKKRSR